jgi:cell division septal protein FtsQ
VVKRLPVVLRVEVDERRPVALLRTYGGLVLVDAEGVAFAPLDLDLGVADLLVLSGSSRPHELAAAMRAAAALERVAPEWSATLSEIEILNERDLRLYCAALPFPIVVSHDRLETGIGSLRDHFQELEPHLESVGAVDLRFERYIVVQPGKER